MTITPEQADRLKIDATDGPWFVHTDHDDPDGTYIYNDPGHMCVAIEPLGSDYRPADLELAAAAPDLAQTVIDQAATIAGMTEEWGVAHDGNVICLDFYGTEAEEPGHQRWTESRTRAEKWAAYMRGVFPGETYHIARRTVGPVEVVE